MLLYIPKIQYVGKEIEEADLRFPGLLYKTNHIEGMI